MNGNVAVNYNLTCSTKDGRIVDWIARQLVKHIGSEAISASGIVLQPSGKARVLTVIKDPVDCPPYKVLEVAEGLGRRFCVDIVEADIVGEIPLGVVLACAQHAMAVARIRPGQIKY